MGLGGYLEIHNFTEHSFKRGEVHKYQMHSWKPPEVIEPWKNVKFYIEYDETLFKQVRDDASDVTYICNSLPFSFRVHAGINSNLDAYLKFIYVQKHDDIGLYPDGRQGFRHNGTLHLCIVKSLSENVGKRDT